MNALPFIIVKWWDVRTIVDDPIMTKRGKADVARSASDLALDVSANSDPSLSVSRMLDVSFALGNSHVTPRSPWEQNSFLCNVMGPSTVPWLKPITTLRRTFYVPPKTCESNEKSFQEKKNLVREACHTKLIRQLHPALRLPRKSELKI